MLISLILSVQTIITVFAAASLHLSFPALGKQFEAAHPGVSVRFSFNGSQILEAQLESGAPVDVFASADERWMDKAVQADAVASPAPFASNELVLVTARSSKVQSPHDLSAPGTKLVICAQAVPCGAYARRLLQGMDADPAYGQGYSDSVLRNVVSEELDVESVLSKVTLGEADAGIVYRTDATSQRGLRTIALPVLPGTPVAYYIGVVRTSADASIAAAFVNYVLSPEGQKILAGYGFTAVKP
jgi:molybdate transport system substrate-binding protein